MCYYDRYNYFGKFKKSRFSLEKTTFISLQNITVTVNETTEIKLFIENIFLKHLRNKFK